MCGVAGGLFFQRDRSETELENLAEAMSQRLVHRGPDDSGVLVEPRLGLYLAHRRLSIVDTTSNGHQPMRSSCGRYVISYNGETYNAVDLRKELRRLGRQFRGHSDTEVVLEAIAEYGPEKALQKLNGMFAFAVYDFQDEVLYLARDRLGIKPLYFWHANEFCTFASEIKALRCHPCWQEVIDRNSVASFLRNSYIPAPHSIYKDVSKLMPGQLIAINRQGHMRKQIFWSLDQVVRERVLEEDSQQAKDSLRQCLERAVRNQMIADVPFGAFLSGGVDSTLIVSLMQQFSSRPIKTFTIGFEKGSFNEACHADAIARHIGTEHHALYLNPSDLIDVIPKMVDVYDEPFSDSSQLPTFLLAQMTAGEVKVALSGDGGDELFAGYDRYHAAAGLVRAIESIPGTMCRGAARTLQLIHPETWQKLLRFVPSHKKPVAAGYRINALCKELTKLSPALYPIINGHWPEPTALVTTAEEYRTIAWDELLCDRFLNPIERWQYVDTLTYLPDDILTKVDRASMAHSLEVRVPLLDHQVVEAVWNLPTSMRAQKKGAKVMFRDLVAEYVPTELTDRPKMGFGIPIDDWLRGPLREWAEDLVSTIAPGETDLINPEPVNKFWNQHKAGSENWGYWLWDVLILQSWIVSNKQ